MAMQSAARGGMIAHFRKPIGYICPEIASGSGILTDHFYLFDLPEGENLQGKALQDFVIDKIDDLKGQDIIALDVQGKSSITDCMIICTGTSRPPCYVHC